MRIVALLEGWGTTEQKEKASLERLCELWNNMKVGRTRQQVNSSRNANKLKGMIMLWEMAEIMRLLFDGLRLLSEKEKKVTFRKTWKSHIITEITNQDNRERDNKENQYL